MPSRLPVPHPSRRPKQQCRETRSKFSSMLPTVLISSLSVTEVTGMLLGSVRFVAMGLSRVFLGYHWLTDVLAGWTLGLAWVVVVITCHRLYLTVKRTRFSRADSRQQ